MIFIIDGIDREAVRLGLFDGQKVIFHQFKSERDLSEKLPQEVANFLKKQKIKFSDLNGVAIAAGPGRFSRIRTCVAFANALAYSLKTGIIPLPNGWKTGDLSQNSRQLPVKPIYDQVPNITFSKQSLTISPKRLR